MGSACDGFIGYPGGRLTRKPQPNPGSAEAIEAGCTCPVIDNGHGKGRGGDGARFGWFVSGDCPLHRAPTVEPKEEK